PGLSRKGFEIGAHTMSHPDLGHIDGESAEHEILGSRRRLEEELGEPVTLFAYPFGGRANLSEANRERVRRAGYRCCMSAYGGVVDRRTDRYDVPRVAVDRWFRSPYHWGLVLLLGRDRQGARGRATGLRNSESTTASSVGCRHGQGRMSSGQTSVGCPDSNANRRGEKANVKILKVWDADYPRDVRVETVCRALHGAGPEVHLVARNRQRRERFERLPYATVHRLGNFGLLGRAIDDAISFPAFCNPRWVRLIHGTASRAGAELILCRDLPLAPAAIWAGRRLGVPVVLDMAENYPAMIRAMWDARRQRPHDWLVRNPAAVARVEQWAIRRVDHILVVVEESRERLTELGVSGDRITIVSNTPSKSRPASLAHPSRGE